jgi:hypothetical protein
VTMDGYYRNGELIDHKAKADEAVSVAREQGVEVEKVLVWRRHPGQYSSKTPMVEGRDFFVDELLKEYAGKMVEPLSMPAENASNRVRCRLRSLRRSRLSAALNNESPGGCETALTRRPRKSHAFGRGTRVDSLFGAVTRPCDPVGAENRVPSFMRRPRTRGRDRRVGHAGEPRLGRRRAKARPIRSSRGALIE